MIAEATLSRLGVDDPEPQDRLFEIVDGIGEACPRGCQRLSAILGPCLGQPDRCDENAVPLLLDATVALHMASDIRIEGLDHSSR